LPPGPARSCVRASTASACSRRRPLGVAPLYSWYAGNREYVSVLLTQHTSYAPRSATTRTGGP
jgi:hypothetical protein